MFENQPEGLLVSTAHTAPIRNSVLGINMLLSDPLYQFRVMFSVDTTRAYPPLPRSRNKRRAKPVAMMPAEQPIPPKLYDSMSVLILKWLIIIAVKTIKRQRKYIF